MKTSQKLLELAALALTSANDAVDMLDMQQINAFVIGPTRKIKAASNDVAAELVTLANEALAREAA